MKRCFKCGRSQPLANFYRHPQMADGHLGKCKECSKRDVRENYAKHIEYYREYDKTRFQIDPTRLEQARLYAKTKRGRASHAAALKRQKELHPEKYRARIACSNAIRAGKLKRGKCAVCGTSKTHAHHADYSKPLEVTWLCPLHHRSVHGMRR